MVLDFNYQDIVEQCDTMVYLNTLSYCLLSGCGNIELPSENEMEKLYSCLCDMDEHSKPSNVFFMTSLYKRCMPYYAQPPESPYDFSSFQWMHKKMRKIIKPEIMSYSIFCLSLLAKKVSTGEIKPENKRFLHFCLLNAAMKQALFCKQYLKIGDLYYNAEDVSSNSYGEYQIEINPNEPKLTAQLQLLEAYAALLSNEELSEHYSPSTISSIEGEFKLLSVICQNITDNINLINSRELSLIGISIYNIHKRIPEQNEITYDALNIIGCELFERLYSNGDIARSIIDREPSSLITLCNCLRYFALLCNINELEMYKKAVHKLYDRVDSFWNDNMGLFVNVNEKKARYTIKDIGYVFASLKALKNYLKDDELLIYVEKQLSNFYRAAIVNSKIFNNQAFPILQNNKLELHTLGTGDRKMPPIFLCEFEIKLNRKKYYSRPGIMKPEYVLCGCKHLIT